MTTRRRIAPLAFASLVLALAGSLFPSQAAVDKSATERAFRAWLANELWPQARARNVSRRTFETAAASLRLQWSLPDLQPPGAPRSRPQAQRQSEFRSPSRYFSENNLNTLVAIGRRHMAQWESTIARIEARYGVPGRILIAIWGRESGYGRAPLPHNAVAVLATQAFMGRRKAFFLEETLAALVILEQDHFAGTALKSSWAGALGGPQFMPSKFLSHAVDFDGDGKRDIWNSVPDTLASIANYLQQHGWQTGRDWGYEVRVPGSVSCSLEGPEQGRPIDQWTATGITRVSGRPFPDHERRQTGFLLMPAGRYGPAFVTTPNFYVLKAYNESDVYALFIGHLADRIAYSNKPLVGNWSDPTGFGRNDVERMQQRLIAQGYDVGGADGLVGFKTRTAIGLWQARHRQSATCYPDRNLIGQIR